MIVDFWKPESQEWAPLVLRGEWGPTLRAADSASAEAIASVLSTSLQIPERALVLFDDVHRLAECDEASANLRAQNLLRYVNPKPKLLEVVCLAHKCHAVSEKVFAVDRPALTALTRILLSLIHGQHLMQFLRALQSEIEARCVRIVVEGDQDNLTGAAMAHRQNILRVYLPEKHHCRRRAVVTTMCAVFNGDWAVRGEFQHYCLDENCCASRQESVWKMQHVMRRAMKSLKPSKLARSNWLEWHRSVDFVCLLCHIHDLFRIAYLAAFHGVPPQECGRCLLASFRSGIGPLPEF